MKLITLKIGRHEYDITEQDVFMDNGAVVLLVTQSNELGCYGGIPAPRLSKRAVKEIEIFDRVELRKQLYGPVSYFMLRTKTAGVL